MSDTITENVILPPNPNISQMFSCRELYDRIILENISLVLGRYGGKKNYPWIDTKFDISSGRDFSEADPIRGQTAVYGWIQGRALESIAEHVKWLLIRPSTAESMSLVTRSKDILRCLAKHLETILSRNNGHLFFLMTPEGQPCTIDTQGRRNEIILTSKSSYNYTDLFAAKGLYAAGICLEDDDMCRRANQYCLNICAAICEGTFVSDQQQLDCRNPSQFQIGRYSFAPYMLAIGMVTLLAAHEPQQKWITVGLDMVDTILNHHVNFEGKWPFLHQWDISEFVNDNANPYKSNGMILSDPGHALEFVGLTLKFLDTISCVCPPDQRHCIDRIAKSMPYILENNFSNGYQPQVGGICKLFDLVSRMPVNSDMPWWSLPESMRAAMYCWQLAQSDSMKANCLNIISKCHNTFITRYIRPQCGYMPVQTLASDGSVSSAIPAVPDADPCYHTGLSLIDILMVMERNKS
ncbi:MAG: AGE family epimerase/isomerase [Sedimentisphaerales bacterium]